MTVLDRPGLFGCGSLSDADGEPLRPGGLELTRELIDLAGFGAGGNVVDVGCGLGASTRLLESRGVAAIGVDLAMPDGVDGAPPFVLADAARLPFADASVDGVLSECVLSIVADRRAALAEWRRVLRSGGRLALSDVYCRGAGATQSIASRETLCADVAAAGFSVTRFEDRSNALKGWAARFIFQHGSLEPLWGCVSNARAIGKAKLGYAILTAIAADPSDRAGA